MEERACALSSLRPHPTSAVGWRWAQASWQRGPPGRLWAALAAFLAYSGGRRARSRVSLQDGGTEEEPATKCEEPTRSSGWGLGARGDLSGASAAPSPPLVASPSLAGCGRRPPLSRAGPPLIPDPGCVRPRKACACALPAGPSGARIRGPAAASVKGAWRVGAFWSLQGQWRAAAERAGVASLPRALGGSCDNNHHSSSSSQLCIAYYIPGSVPIALYF